MSDQPTTEKTKDGIYVVRFPDGTSSQWPTRVAAQEAVDAFTRARVRQVEAKNRADEKTRLRPDNEEQIRIMFEGEHDPETFNELLILESRIPDIDVSSPERVVTPTRRQLLDGYAANGLLRHDLPSHGFGERWNLTERGVVKLKELQRRYRQLTWLFHFDLPDYQRRDVAPCETIFLGREAPEPGVTYTGGPVVSADKWRLWKKHCPHVCISTTTSGEWLLTNTSRGSHWVWVYTQGRRLRVFQFHFLPEVCPGLEPYINTLPRHAGPTKGDARKAQQLPMLTRVMHTIDDWYVMHRS